MPTPIAHSLAAVALKNIDRDRHIFGVWTLPLLVVLANLADVDFIPGYLAADPTGFHWGATHSLLAIVGVSALAGIVAARTSGRYLAGVALAGAAYGSHVLLDLMIGGKSETPVGLQLLWPLSHRPFRLEWSLFKMAPLSISTDGPLSILLSPQILPMIGRELLVMTPVVLASWALTRRRTAPQGSGAAQRSRARS